LKRGKPLLKQQTQTELIMTNASFLIGTIGSLIVFGRAEYLYQTNRVNSDTAVRAGVLTGLTKLMHEGSHLVVAEMLGARVSQACARFNSDFGKSEGPYVMVHFTSKTTQSLASLGPVLLCAPLAAYMLLAQPLDTGWLNGFLGVTAAIATYLSKEDRKLAKTGIKAVGLLTASLGLMAAATGSLLVGLGHVQAPAALSFLAKLF
jgi:hypothetical protein